ncbi:MAG: aminopeptidase P family protein [Actinomycetaceae bacterium]|nr:aminopeptidase P family protein [Actinomycetaceae bacterium]
MTTDSAPISPSQPPANPSDTAATGGISPTEGSGKSQPIADRGSNRSRRPESEAFRAFMGSHWAPRQTAAVQREAVADYLPARAATAGMPFAGERLVVPAGTYKVRSNDTDYRFRAHSAFAHLSGLGAEKEPDAVLLLEPTDESETGTTHEAVLYFKPRASRSSREFYADSRYGEFWVGARPSLEEVEAAIGIRCAHIDTLRDALAKDAGSTRLRIVRGVDTAVQTMVDEVRIEAGLPAGDDAREDDERFEEHLSEIRLCKDAWEVEELRRAVEVTAAGFDDIIRSFPRAVNHHRGERVIESAFGARAREEGNGLGYDTIAAAGNHANTLHWIDNNGPVREGDLVLIDAGVEVDSLYTADITRTLPVSGTFTEVQAKVYQAVLDACEAALVAANKPGARFKDLHAAATEVLAERLESWGLLPVSKEEALSPEGQHHRRWMPHGTSHHLGLDVHDCAQARAEMYMDALLEPGMCFTIEPGLYFRTDDELLPEEFRGIGVRIEDDVVVNADGTVTRLSEDIPRTIADVEAWIARVQGA